jgi:hypothetical protein
VLHKLLLDNDDFGYLEVSIEIKNNGYVESIKMYSSPSK